MLEILFEDKDVIVVIKPYGVSSQNERGSASDMMSMLMNYFYEKGEKNSNPYVIHRLDKNVSGVMVYAKNKSAAASLSSQVSKRQMEKKYYAVLFMDGTSEEKFPKKGELKDLMYRDGSTNTSFVVKDNSEHTDAKMSHLSYEIIDEKNVEGVGFGLADICLYTGRHHQIRVQFGSRNCPLLGDKKYGKDRNILFEETLEPVDIARLKLRNISLYSYHISFNHPTTKKKMSFEKKPDFGIFKCFNI